MMEPKTKARASSVQQPPGSRCPPKFQPPSEWLEDQPGGPHDGFYSADEDGCEGKRGGTCVEEANGAVPQLDVKKRRLSDSAGMRRQDEQQVDVEPSPKQGVRSWLARIFKRV